MVEITAAALAELIAARMAVRSAAAAAINSGDAVTNAIAHISDRRNVEKPTGIQRNGNPASTGGGMFRFR
ncbi:hypothetical protein LAUMK7_00475 [Mycobacterium kansasii]|nr:hypothetical protein LAUMK7_00475 [Mycobacterium kansasii]VBA44846.1 hypothetical protein LAUMK191_00134 [Mycobacterium attenuatum]